jgi:hypothetical protein
MMRSRSPVMAIHDGSEVTATFAVGLVRHVVPWFLLLLVLAAGLISHVSWGGAAALPWITAAITPAVGGLTWLAWTVCRVRHVGPAGRAHVAGTVAAAGLWFLGATVAGPLSHPVLDLWGLVGTFLAVSWNLRLVLHRSRREEDDEPNTPRRAGRALMASLGIRGAELRPEHVDPNRVSGTLALTGEHTVEDVQKRAHQLAAALEIPRSGVRFTEDPDNAGRADFCLTMRDMLKVSTPWPGPSAVGGTVFDPIPMGLYETGEVLCKTIANKSGAKHELQQGTTGAGKSSGTGVELCELMPRREVALIVVDTVKGIQGFGPAAPGLALFVIDERRAKRFMKRLLPVIKARTDYLGAKKLREWVPGCGLTFLVIQLEEAGILLEELGKEVTDALKAARSAGISLKVSLQRPSHDEIPTTARAQLGSVSCYGMAADDPVCLLPDAVQDAGADPRRWGDRQPGCLYFAGTGVTVAQAATPARTYDLTVDVMGQVAERFGPQMDPIDSVTTRALGDLWTDRIPPVEVVARATAQALGGLPAAPASPVGELPGRGDQADGGDLAVTGMSPEEMGVSTPDPDPEVTGSIDDGMESVGVDFAFGKPPSEVSPGQAREAVAGRLAEIEGAGRDTVRVPDFSDLVRAGLRSRGWFRKELLRLVAVGRLVDEGDGEFRIVPGRDVPDDAARAA